MGLLGVVWLCVLIRSRGGGVKGVWWGWLCWGKGVEVVILVA